jgi:hypothetical protein
MSKAGKTNRVLQNLRLFIFSFTDVKSRQDQPGGPAHYDVLGISKGDWEKSLLDERHSPGRTFCNASYRATCSRKGFNKGWAGVSPIKGRRGFTNI